MPAKNGERKQEKEEEKRPPFCLIYFVRSLFTYFGSDLVATLASLHMHDFSHGCCGASTESTENTERTIARRQGVGE